MDGKFHVVKLENEALEKYKGLSPKCVNQRAKTTLFSDYPKFSLNKHIFMIC